MKDVSKPDLARLAYCQPLMKDVSKPDMKLKQDRLHILDTIKLVAASGTVTNTSESCLGGRVSTNNAHRI